MHRVVGGGSPNGRGSSFPAVGGNSQRPRYGRSQVSPRLRWDSIHIFCVGGPQKSTSKNKNKKALPPNKKAKQKQKTKTKTLWVCLAVCRREAFACLPDALCRRVCAQLGRRTKKNTAQNTGHRTHSTEHTTHNTDT